MVIQEIKDTNNRSYVLIFKFKILLVVIRKKFWNLEFGQEFDLVDVKRNFVENLIWQIFAKSSESVILSSCQKFFL